MKGQGWMMSGLVVLLVGCGDSEPPTQKAEQTAPGPAAEAGQGREPGGPAESSPLPLRKLAP